MTAREDAVRHAAQAMVTRHLEDRSWLALGEAAVNAVVPPGHVVIPADLVWRVQAVLDSYGGNGLPAQLAAELRDLHAKWTVQP